MLKKLGETLSRVSKIREMFSSDLYSPPERIFIEEVLGLIFKYGGEGWEELFISALPITSPEQSEESLERGVELIRKSWALSKVLRECVSSGVFKGLSEEEFLKLEKGLEEALKELESFKETRKST